MDPKYTRIIAVVVVLVLVIAGVSIYYVQTHKSTSCHLTSTNPLIMDQVEMPDTLDPAVTFNTPGWAAIYETYQPLIMYNGTSYTNFTGILAQNWSPSSDGFHYNFTLRSGIHFSNGDPFNAYVLWFSLYRTLAMASSSSFILSQNFYYPFVSYYSPSAQINASLANLTNELNSWNFFSPTPSQVAIMAAANQSFRALNDNLFQVNMGFGYLGAIAYTYILASLVAPVAVAVDPAVVQAHGGVTDGGKSGYMTQYMLGTGPFTFAGPFSSASSASMTFAVDPNYWGKASAAAEPWNNGLQPAKTNVETDFQQNSAIDVQNLKTGDAASVSLVYSGPQTVTSLQNVACVSIVAEPVVYGATAGSWYVYMNQQSAPFTNWSVRAAVTHAINYQQIIQVAFGGDGTQWVGPVPPSYPDYNPKNLAPYSYNLTLAKQEMAASPWPNGYPGTLNYEYINTPVWQNVATLLQTELAAIGININPIPVQLNTLYTLQQIDSTTGKCTAQESPNSYGGPFPIGQEFYTSDYISPDDWTQNVAISYGSANQCMAGYANATMDALVLQGAGEHNPAAAAQEYANMTQMMYNNYTDAWLVVPTAFGVSHTSLQGQITNPMGSALPFVMMYNTEYAG